MSISRTVLSMTVTMLVSLWTGHSAYAQGTATTLTIVPHCSVAVRTACPAFKVLDAESLTTGKLTAGDILDIDIVLRTNAPQSVDSIRAWLSYDSQVLEARSVELTKLIVAPTPGEQNVDSVMRVVKIGGAVQGTLKDQDAVIARVTFRVTSAAKDTMISFMDYQASGSGHTAVNGKNNKEPLLASEPSKLRVVLTNPSTANTGSVLIQTPIVSQQETVPVVAEIEDTRSSFSLIQIQNVRITTRERDIFLGWQGLKSSGLKGYNVYYGTVTGRYIQRKTLPASSVSLVLRDLEPGTTYYVALRALNTTDEESAFSQEVSVEVGAPETSSAALTNFSDPVGADVDGNPIDKHEGTVITGETGVGSTLVVFLLISAAIGTLCAARRQSLFLPLKP